MQDMLVSIITIVYNGDKFIEHTIQSVISQSYKNIEYIIVDGGSTDNTIPVIKKYEHAISTWISEKDNGISDAFNKGLALSHGDLIGIINADDWYEPGTVEKVVKRLGEADIIYGDLRLWKEGKQDFILKGDHHFLINEMTVNHPTVFIRKTCYGRFGTFDDNYKCAMDYDLLLRFFLMNCRFRYVPEVLANMRWEGLSDSQWIKGCRETFQIKNKYLPRQKFKNRLYYYKHVTAIAVSKFISKTRFHFLIKKYRSRFAKVRKVYD